MLRKAKKGRNAKKICRISRVPWRRRCGLPRGQNRVREADLENAEADLENAEADLENAEADLENTPRRSTVCSRAA